MSIWERFGKKTVESVKQAAKDMTVEDSNDVLDIVERVVKVLAIGGIVLIAAKGGRHGMHNYAAPVNNYATPVSATPATVINLIIDPGKGATI